MHDGILRVYTHIFPMAAPFAGLAVRDRWENWTLHSSRHRVAQLQTVYFDYARSQEPDTTAILSQQAATKLNDPQHCRQVIDVVMVSAPGLRV